VSTPKEHSEQYPGAIRSWHEGLAQLTIASGITTLALGATSLVMQRLPVEVITGPALATMLAHDSLVAGGVCVASMVSFLEVDYGKGIGH
jgi:hypothetical protein